jgi:hypothetical protein
MSQESHVPFKQFGAVRLALRFVLLDPLASETGKWQNKTARHFS